MRIRTATPDDAGAIAGLEHSASLVRDDGARITLLRGARLFDQLRLMDDARVFVAEVDGAAIGCEAAGVHDVYVGGSFRRLLYRHHVRVLPRHRRRGVHEALSARVLDFARDAHVDGGYVYVDPRNAIVRQWQSSKSGAETWRNAPPWECRPLRALLRCDRLAADDAGRPGSPADARRIVSLINACHGKEEMFLPYDEERLAARLARLPGAYDWTSLLLEGLATVGVWDAGERCLREDQGKETALPTESVRAFVLDHGFDPQRGVEDFERLLRAWCTRLAERGTTHLSIFTSPGSQGYPLICSLAESVSEVQIHSTIPEPAGICDHGVYVDHVYY